MKAFFSEALTTGLNHYLALDPESSLRIKALEGKTVTVELLSLGWILQLVFADGKVSLQWDEFAESRVHVGVVRPVELIGPGEAIRSSRVCGKGSTVQPCGDFSVLGAGVADQVRPVIAYAG